jgi:hypothetical protein
LGALRSTVSVFLRPPLKPVIESRSADLPLDAGGGGVLAPLAGGGGGGADFDGGGGGGGFEVC